MFPFSCPYFQQNRFQNAKLFVCVSQSKELNQTQKKTSPKHEESNHTQEKGFIFGSVMTCCSFCFCCNRLVAHWACWHASWHDPELLA